MAKQAEDNVTREMPGVTRPGRKPIGDKPMTAAERQARSRANRLGELVGQIELARQELREAFVMPEVIGTEAAKRILAALDHLTLAKVAAGWHAVDTQGA